MFEDQLSIFEMQAELCRAMSHTIRFEILYLLRERPKCVSELAKAAGRTRAVVSKHLVTLRNAGAIIGQRQRQEIYYQIADPKIVSVCDPDAPGAGRAGTPPLKGDESHGR
jgi:ArsR family transcriptional regulator